MNIVILCHYFWPEPCAPAARLKEMAETWCDEGHHVSVVTNFPNHPTGVIPEEYSGKSFMEEELGKIRILRCKTYATPNRGIIKKTFGHLYFAYKAVRQATKLLKGTDIIVFSSPPLFTGIAAWYMSKKLKCEYIIEVRDLWPAIFVELGVLKNRILIKILEIFELFLYKKSTKVIALTNSFAEDIISRNTPREKVDVIPNGVDLKTFCPSDEKPTELIAELGVKDKFVALYLGTHGISQNLFTLIDVADILKKKGHEDIEIMFVGEGADKNKLMKIAAEKNLDNIRFLPAQPKEKVIEFYRMAGVCMVPLKDIPLFTTFIPSKMFEIMGAEKPLIASVAGEAADILAKSDGGAVICHPDNSQEIADAIIDLKKHPEKCEEIRKKGRIFAAANYDRKMLAKKYVGIMEKEVAKK